MQARFHLYLLLIGVFGGVATAQNSTPVRAISGMVQDRSGAVIPGAQILVTTQDGKSVAKGTTDGAGNFSFSGIAAGSYIVDVTKDGFREAKQTTRVGVQAHPPLRIVMQVAVVTQGITVAGSESSAKVSGEIAETRAGIPLTVIHSIACRSSITTSVLIEEGGSKPR